MKNPQTVAEKLYQQFPTLKLKSIKDYSCCAFVLMWCCGIDVDDTEAIITVGKMMDKGVIGPDCCVFWNSASEFLTGRSLKVDFVDITSIKGIKERTPVRYDYKGKSHWVGVEGGKIKFNSLADSNCVKNGKPVTARILHFSGDKK
jgi:hypothetical protein